MSSLALRLGAGQRLSVLVLLGTCLSAATPASAFSILHHFVGGASDGREPEAPLIVDADGNLYGTTNVGGSAGLGTVFTLKTDGTGFRILHSFGSGPSDAIYPLAGLILDAAGSLYGTTERGVR